MSTNSYVSVHGLQSFGLNTRFTIDWAFEMGQLAVYEAIDASAPDVEVSLSKVLDGYPPLYLLATQNAPDISLVGRSNQRCMVAASFYGDTQGAASGVPQYQCTMSGMYAASMSWDFNVGGNSTETLTLVGNDKVWSSGTPFTYSGAFGSDIPLAAGGIDRKQNFHLYDSILPKSLPGISPSGTNDLNPVNGQYNCHLQSVKVSASLGREPLYELGRKGPYFRYVAFPVPVKCDIEIMANTPDLVSATQAGVFGSGNNLVSEDIFIKTDEGTKLTLGNNCKLTNVAYGGANAGGRGGNATITYAYEGMDICSVQHPQDPTVALAG